MKSTDNQHIWQNIKKTADVLHQGPRRIALLIHINPDGDALGSSLGLLRVLNNLGHTCQVISPNNFPGFLRWLPGSEKITILRNTPEKAFKIMEHAEILFAVDFNELKRVKELNDAFTGSTAFKILIDHHPHPALKADCLLSDVTASSTAELVFDFIGKTNLTPYFDRQAATCLFTGIMTDTGCFSYNSSNRKTWETVARLLDYGINKDEIYYRTYDNFSANRMKLLGYCLNEKMEILPEFHTAYICLTRDDLHKYEFESGDSEGFVNYPLSIKGVRFSAFFIENDTNVRISFRSKGRFAVNEFAKKGFNGGGHANASGAESTLGLAETIQRFKELLVEFKNELSEDED
jgi:phosphoesterase RecJ-like protein